jgi:NADH:ubiquinone oxidoreductase subunit
MAKLSLRNVLTNFYIRIVTWRTGIPVGSDELGNQYYKATKPGQWGREPRWVIYAGEDEASMVPAEWHGWLHHRAAQPPTELPPVHQAWQKPHLPNKTGTEAAYRPPGHTLEGGHRARATGDYQAWTPS